MKRLFTLLALMIFYCNATFAWEYLEVHNVDWWWEQSNGTIESASILVEPKGFYAECSLILEFSAFSEWFEPESSLEVDMNFRLPANASITDLYLWIEGEPVRGDIYDKWTASLIYESIVQRRIDPAILTVVSGNEYNLKVFPLPVEGTRKVMIQYLTPVGNALIGEPLVQIPLNILKLSYEMPDKFKIAFKGGNRYKSPAIRETQQAEFSYGQDNDFGDCWVTNLTDLKDFSSVSLSYQHEVESNLKLSTYTHTSTGDKYFQLAMNHVNAFDVEQRRKAVFLIDFIDKNSQKFNKKDILDELEVSIRNSYTEKDSFNILFSGLSTTYASNEWICGNSDTVSALFDGFSSALFNEYSNLPSLLIDGIDFIKNNGNVGSLILLSSSNSNGESTEANALITDFLEAIGENGIPIHIVDVDDQHYSYNERHLIGGQYFSGNEYFYSRLSQLTVGEYHSIRTNSLPLMLEKVNHRTAGYFKSLEVFIQTRGGYAFSNYRLNTTSGLTYNDEALCLVGRYIGEPPFEISIFGQDFSNDVYFNCDTVPEEQIVLSDSVLKSIWSVHKIRDLLGLEQNNQIVNQIIEASISERILCNYTAFLVLEPDFVIPDEFEDDEELWEEDGWATVSLETDFEPKEFSLSNYPNPFNEKTRISYAVAESASVNISIYNAMGQLVKVLINETIPGGEYTLDLYGSELEKGLYHCVMLVDGKAVKRIKLVVL